MGGVQPEVVDSFRPVPIDALYACVDGRPGHPVSRVVLLQVQDELLFEVPAAEVEGTRAEVTRVMESVASLDIPLVLDTGVGTDWDEAH